MVEPRRYSALIIDDADGLRELVRYILRDSGRFHPVIEARDAREGIELVLAHGPDLVLLDISMPGMDGLEALRRMRKAPRFPVVVVLSAFRADVAEGRALELGAAAYVEKGISPDDLIQLLLGCLERAGAA